MQKRQKWNNRLKDLKIGDLVLIQHENIPHRLWPLGLVVHCNEGRDGLVRSVRVKTPTGALVRPIAKLVLLEASLIGVLLLLYHTLCYSIFISCILLVNVSLEGFFQGMGVLLPVK